MFKEDVRCVDGQGTLIVEVNFSPLERFRERLTFSRVSVPWLN